MTARADLRFWLPSLLLMLLLVRTSGADDVAVEAPVHKPIAVEATEQPAPEQEAKPVEVGKADAEKEAAGEEKESRFMRLDRDEKGELLSMDTAVVSYIPAVAGAAPLTVDLVGAVHVGDQSYYDELNKLFKTYDVVLYELVAPKGTTIPKNTKVEGRGHPIAMLQGGMKDILKLEHQLEQVDYTPKNFVHADMSPAEFAKSMEKRGESFLGMLLRSMGHGMAKQGQKGTPGDADLLFALFARDRDIRLKRMMAEQMEDLEGATMAIGGPDGSTIIESRNDVALKVLQNEIAKGNKKIAIFYGAGHLPDMHDKLLKDFKLKRDETRWLKAWNLKSK